MPTLARAFSTPISAFVTTCRCAGLRGLLHLLMAIPYWIAHNQGGAREQNAETVALRKTRNSGFEHPERVRGFSRTHHQCRDFSQFFGSFRVCALQFGARITQRAYIPTRKRIIQRLARSLQRI